jgi:hypothetical protein
MGTDLRTPHFLRVTQALALVSGIGMTVGMALSACGGSVVITTTSSNDDSGSGQDGSYGGCGYGGCPGPYDGAPSGIVLFYDGGASGVIDAGAYEVGPGGVVAYDGGPTGVGVYDGGPTGVVVYDGGPLGIGIYDGGPIGIGGPLVAPELPA